MTKLMEVFRQAYELDKQKVKLEVKIHDMEKESSRRGEVRAKLKDKVK